MLVRDGLVNNVGSSTAPGPDSSPCTCPKVGHGPSPRHLSFGHRSFLSPLSAMQVSLASSPAAVVSVLQSPHGIEGLKKWLTRRTRSME